MSVVILGEEEMLVKFAVTSCVMLGLKPIVVRGDEQKLRSCLNRIQETQIDTVMVACSKEDLGKWEGFVDRNVYHRGFNFPVIWNILKPSEVS